MGWQGKMRGPKGEQYFSLLPEHIRKQFEFVWAASWRDDTHVWIRMRAKDGGQEQSVRMRRSTGAIEPI